MKKLIILFLLLIGGICKGQNLVPNSSFEIVDSCNSHLQGGIWWGNAPPWNSPSYGSIDLFNTCSTNLGFSVPNNNWGFQYSHSGNGYAGGDLTEEYLQIELDSALTQNRIYCVSFYINLSNIVGMATNNFGTYFADSQTYIPTLNYLNFTPQINDVNIVSDTANWSFVHGEYTAIGGEKFIIIGTFDPFYLCDTVHLNNPFSGPYYFIDDISLTDCSVGINETTNKMDFNIYPTPITSFLTIQTNTTEPSEIILYDLSSRKLLQQSFTTTTTLNTESLAKGMYIYQVRNKKGISKTGKVIKE